MTEITIPFVGSSLPGTGVNLNQVFGVIFNYVSQTSQPAGSTLQIPTNVINSTNNYYYIPQTLTKVTVLRGNIPEYGFYGMTWLKEIVINNSDVLIGSYSFFNLSTTSIVFPNSLIVGQQTTIKALDFNSYFVWGENQNNIFNDNQLMNANLPISSSPFGGIFTSVGIGDSFITVALTSGNVYSIGNNSNGQLGLGNTLDQNIYQLINFPSLQTQEKIYRVQSQTNYSAAISSSRRLFMWGDNTYSQLGNGNTTQQNSPILVSVPGTISQITLGPTHAVALNTAGQIYAWGRNNQGQLGDSTTTNKSTPTLIGLPNLNVGEVATMIRTGTEFSLALTNQGRIYAWGINNVGQLGASLALTRSILPRLIVLPSLRLSETIVSIETGINSAYALTNQGRLLVWGANNKGQLGNGNTSNITSPEIVDLALQNIVISQIKAGNHFVIAVAQNGELYSWGDNSKGQLGLGDYDQRNVPTKINFN
jgi:alpha-tubulin suppressor-like RCC1 family protein